MTDGACLNEHLITRSDNTITLQCDQFVQNLLAKAQSSYPSAEPTVPTTAAISATVVDALSKSEQLRKKFGDSVSQAADVEKASELLPRPKQEQVHDLLVNGKIDEAENIVNEEGRVEEYSAVGLEYSAISDQKIGDNGRMFGLAGSGTFSTTDFMSAKASFLVAQEVDWLFGHVDLPGGSKFAMSMAGRIGPRLRFGYPIGVTFGVYYDVPLLNVTQGSAYFPLIGGAADAGFQLGPVRLTCLYRYDANSILYPHRPNLSFLGGVATFAPGLLQ